MAMDRMSVRCGDRLLGRLAAALRLALASAAPAPANDLMGVRAGVYADVEEPFVGVELLLALGDRVYLNPNFEYVFVENPST